jgi:indolepyruvate ferredoxin oxidoreductase, alpha subunit
VETCNPLKLDEAMAAVTRAADASAHGVTALIFASPCIQLTPPGPALAVNRDVCQCKLCVTRLGCPAISSVEGKASIDPSLCNGCGLCAQICPFQAIAPVAVAEVTR